SSRVSSTSGALGSRLLREITSGSKHADPGGSVPTPRVHGQNRGQAPLDPPAAPFSLVRRATSASLTKSGRNRDTSPPNRATSLTRLEARKEYSGAVGTNTVSTSSASEAFICAICSS